MYNCHLSFDAERPIVIGFPVMDPLNIVERCYEEFREHCVERHDLRENDTDAQMWVDFKEGTLTLWKGENV